MMDQFVYFSNIHWHHYKGRQLFELKEDGYWFMAYLD